MAEFTVEQISEDNIIEVQNNLPGEGEIVGSSVYYGDDQLTLFHFDVRSRETTQLGNEGEIVDGISTLSEVDDIAEVYFNISNPDGEGELRRQAFYDGTFRIAEFNTGSDVVSFDRIQQSDEYYVWTENIRGNGSGTVETTIKVYDARDKSVATLTGSEAVLENGNFPIYFRNLNLHVAEDFIAWEAATAESGEINNIFVYDGNSTVQLTNTPNSETNLVGDGNNIVWTREGTDNEADSNLGNRNVFFYNGLSVSIIGSYGTEEIEGLIVNEPQILGNNIVWSVLEVNDLDDSRKLTLYLYDGNETKSIYEINNSTSEEVDINAIENITLAGNGIAWLDNNDNRNKSLYLYDGSQTRQLTSDSIDPNGFKLDENGNSLIWIALDSDGQQQLYLYDGTETIQLTNYESDIDDPNVGNLGLGDSEITDGQVVWAALDAQNQEQLFLYDGNSTSQLSSFDPDSSRFSDFEIIDGKAAFAIEDENSFDRLYFFDGESLIQLYQAESITGDGVSEFEIVDNSVFWTAGGNQFFYDGSDISQINILEDGSTVFIEEYEVLSNRIVFVVDKDEGNNNLPFDDPALDLEIFEATPSNENPNTVYRFLNQDTGVHFYTANIEERNLIQDELDNFGFEGESYIGVDPLTGQPEPSPVYRFLNQDTGVHLYTISEVERDATQELDNFSFEGEAFFAYDSEVDGSIPIYRFFNTTSGAHFYTPSAAERENVEANLPDFQSEGIAYYALPIDE